MVTRFPLLVFMISLIVMGLASAVDNPIVKLDSNNKLLLQCQNNGLACSGNEIGNISIYYPNKTAYVVNGKLEKENNVLFYNLSLSEIGIYEAAGFIQDGSSTAPFNFNFEVTGSGTSVSTSKSILYTVIFILSIIFFILFIIAGMFLPHENKKDQMTGYILAVENLKYVKILSFALAYLCLMLMTYFGWIISYGFLDLDFLGNLFKFAFYAMVIILLPLFIVGVYITFANLTRDSNISEALQGGLRIKE